MIDIDIYAIDSDCPRLDIVPPTVERNWFAPHAYRCMPLKAMNRVGWDLRVPYDICVAWNGGPAAKDVEVTRGAPGAESHFGMGTFTINVGYIWKMPPGWQLMLMPVPNGDLIGCEAMSAIMELEVLDYPWFLTMRLFEKTPPCVTIRGGTIIGRAVPVQLPENKRPTLRIHPSETEHMKFERHCLTHRREAETAAGEKWGREYHDAAEEADVRYGVESEIDSPFDDPADATVITDDNVEAVRVLRGHGIHVIDNYLTGEECEELIATFEPEQLEQGANGADEWNGRISFDEYPEHLKYKMTEGRVKAAEKIYGESLVIDFPHLALWREGNFKIPHSDFGEHNEYLWREYTSLIYLNDDFSGGCLTFPDIGVTATFDGGTLVIFEGGVMKHGIEKVTRGYRYTAPCWFAKTKWKAHLDRRRIQWEGDYTIYNPTPE